MSKIMIFVSRNMFKRRLLNGTRRNAHAYTEAVKNACEVHGKTDTTRSHKNR